MSKPSLPVVPSSLLDMNKGEILSFAVPVFYFSTIPVARYLASTAIPSVLPAVLELFGTKTTSSPIAALGGLYFAVAYPLSAGLSVLGQTMSAGGYKNKNPRPAQKSATGLASRLMSTHFNLMETFPAWAFAAVMVQVLAPKNEYLINLLALHVLLKSVVFPIAYVADVDIVRTSAHMISIGSLLSIFYSLTQL